MKNTILIFLSMVLFCMSCKTNPTIDPNTSAGELSCLIDGNLLSTKVADATNQNGEIWIVAVGKNASISFIIDTKKFKVGSKIDLKPTLNSTTNVNLDCVVNEEAYDPVSGEIYVSAISTKAIAGTFNFSAIETLTAKKVIKITDGKFNVPIR